MPRVVAGLAKGRPLQAPPGTATRPTSDRAREGLFSTLGSLGGVDGARVLDLYAGSGAVGLEALSRGALLATMVESSPAALRVLRANAAAVGLAGADVVASTVAAALGTRAPSAYDVVFLDPPYASDVDPDLALLASRGWLADGAVVAVERSARGAAPVWPDGLVPLRERAYGEAVIHYAVAEGTALLASGGMHEGDA